MMKTAGIITIIQLPSLKNMLISQQPLDLHGPSLSFQQMPLVLQHIQLFLLRESRHTVYA